MPENTLSDLLQNFSGYRADMVDALVEKGVDVDPDAGFSDIADAIGTINVGPNIDIAKLTPSTTNITTSDMYIANVSNKTIVFGMCKCSNTSNATFTIPSTFTPATTTAGSSSKIIYAALSAAGGNTSSSYWTLSGSNFTLRALSANADLWYAALLY